MFSGNVEYIILRSVELSVELDNRCTCPELAVFAFLRRESQKKKKKKDRLDKRRIRSENAAMLRVKVLRTGMRGVISIILAIT